jgi:hypothetical protein
MWKARIEYAEGFDNDMTACVQTGVSPLTAQNMALNREVDSKRRRRLAHVDHGYWTLTERLCGRSTIIICQHG